MINISKEFSSKIFNHVLSLGHLFWLFYTGCNGKKLETVAQSQELFGCTIIVNHLEIRIRKGSKCSCFDIYIYM